MEMAVRILNLLLILIFVFQGLCAVPEIGKRQFPFDTIHGIIPDIIPDVPVDPIPDIPVDPVPDIPVDPVPDIPVDPVPDIPGDPVPPGDGLPVPIPNSGSNGPSPLGEYINNNQAPFSDLSGEWDQFFSRVDDILEAAETDVDDNKPNETPGGPKIGGPAGTPTIMTYTITDFCTPVVGGNCATIPTYITVFDPAQPTNACSAWSSLSVYCGGGGTNCACYSSSYYVPDQWNSLAAVCAKAVTGCPQLQTLPSPPLVPPVPALPSPPPLSLPSPPPLPLTSPPRLSLHPPTSLPPLPRAVSTALKAQDSGFWCDLVLSASSYASYCPTNTPTVAFAAVTPTPTTAAPSGSAATVIEVPRFKILSTALFLVLSAYRIW